MVYIFFYIKIIQIYSGQNFWIKILVLFLCKNLNLFSEIVFHFYNTEKKNFLSQRVSMFVFRNKY